MVFINCGGFDQSRFLDFKHGCNSLPFGSTAKTLKNKIKIVNLRNIQKFLSGKFTFNFRIEIFGCQCNTRTHASTRNWYQYGIQIFEILNI